MKRINSKLYNLLGIIVFIIALSSCVKSEKKYELQLAKEQIIKIEVFYTKRENETILLEDNITLDFEEGISDIVEAIESIAYFEKNVKNDLDFAYQTVDLIIYSTAEIVNITYKELGIKNGYVWYDDLGEWYGVKADTVSMFYEHIKYKIENGLYNVT